MIASRVRDDVLNRRINAGAAGTLDIDDRGLVCLANGNVGLDMLKPAPVGQDTFIARHPRFE